MPDLLPLNPDSPDVEVVSDPDAALLRALCRGKLDTVIDSELALPAPQAVTFFGSQMQCRLSLTY